VSDDLPVPSTQPAPLAGHPAWSFRAVILLSIVAAAIVAVAGLLGEICLGDENVHVRQARTFTESWERLAFDPATVKPDLRARLQFDGTPLWHLGLGALWRVTGPSDAVAQAYHAGFYVLLLLAVYGGVRAAFGVSAACWAWLLTATMPMVCVYSVLLYQDVPGVALTALALWLLWRRQFLASGACLAAAYLTKMNMLSVAPWAAMFALWWCPGRWYRRVGAALTVGLPALAVFAWDVAWRYQHYERGLMGSLIFQNIRMLSYEAQEALRAIPEGYTVWKPFPFWSPRSLVTHVGLLGLAATVVALIRSWDKISQWLWASVALSAAGFYFVFVRLESPQLRYLFPAILVLVVLGGVGLSRLRWPRWALTAAIVLSVLQAGGSLAYVTWQRQVPAEELEAFAWLKEHADPTTRILYPEELLTNYTGLATVWGAANPAYFMTEMSDQTRQEILNVLDVSYLVVPLDRVYDSHVEGVHGGGYAQEFVEAMKHMDYLEVAFENSAVVIFRYKSLQPIPEPPKAAGPSADPGFSRSSP
jgi:4-amino-4-deoxy-L-arabinose transferase-like glycosyltransferase